MKKRITVCLAAVLVLALSAGMYSLSSATSFSSITSDSIREKEEQINKAEEDKKNLESSLTDVKEVKAQLESEKRDLNNYVVQLDLQLEEIQDNIARLNEQIAEKEAEIEETQAQLADARATEEAQYEAMVQRIQFMYEQGESTYLEMILSGESFSDMLNKAEYIEEISAYDRRQLDEFMLNRQLIEACERQLLADKELLDETREGVLAEEAAMEELIAAKEQRIKEYESDIGNKEQAIREYEAYIQEQKEIIEALEAAVTEEKKKLLAQSGVVLTYDGGMFKFPLASYTRISDEYGNRMHPILKVEQFHNGVDFAAPTGTSIYAAYDGVVVAAAYSSSMGNYVMIDHGNNLYTIYMHASQLFVSKDDIVVRGETIAAVGSTGRSTGPHLHFSVRLNGAYTSPWNYLSQ